MVRHLSAGRGFCTSEGGASGPGAVCLGATVAGPPPPWLVGGYSRGSAMCLGTRSFSPTLGSESAHHSSDAPVFGIGSATALFSCSRSLNWLSLGLLGDEAAQHVSPCPLSRRPGLISTTPTLSVDPKRQCKSGRAEPGLGTKQGMAGCGCIHATPPHSPICPFAEGLPL